MDTILVVNAGSSSVKFQVFAAQSSGELTRKIKGQIDGIGTRPRLRGSDADGAQSADREFRPEDVADVPAALHAAAAWLRDELRINPTAIGHRVVHGGPDFDRPVLVTAEVLARLERYVPLAPLHQPHNLSGIRTCAKLVPHVPQVACFDTAFHHTMGPLARRLGLPRAYDEAGVRRYGFHGLSYEFIAQRLQALDPELTHGRVIVAHLGNGASLCAMREGRSVDTTMGFTALDGLLMGTRPGTLDPGAVTYLMREHAMSAAEIEDVLYHRSGLVGVSGISSDMRTLLASGDSHAHEAVELFVFRAAREIGALAASLGGLDGLVFTAGIGEHAPEIRSRICARCAWLGIILDERANGAAAPRITAQASRVRVYVIPTDEERMIAEHTVKHIGQAALLN